MRVKRLEIQGFKSFKDKTVVHFDHSITGIVGPNGCGKSNIVDAFFWVMGEQSYKHMRGSCSEDLIFNGSSKYTPLGLAEATLVMETDAVDTQGEGDGATAQNVPAHLRAKEISVTRRVYRSGEGEYFVNGVPARLKDIQELFMDTGVGAKGYSVIEQGQIGKIVNAKPEERRLLIEEAAGIAKYKARKKESLRKIEATQANLSRLNDVIQEIERNLDSLERQAQKARLYNKYKDELLDKEMTWGRRKAQVLRQKLEVLKTDRETMEQELVGLRAELQATENAMEADRIAQLTDTKLAEDLQARIQSLSSELTREQSALDLSRRRQGDLASQLESLNNERQELDGAIAADHENLKMRAEQLTGAETAFEVAAQKAKAKDDEVRSIRQKTEDARRKADVAKRDMMAAVAQNSDLTSRAAALASRMESAREQAERLETQVRILSEKVDAAREEAEKTSVAAVETKAKLDSARTETKEQSARVREQEQNLRKSEHDRDQTDRQLTQLKSRLQSLEELAAAHEGFADGPKAALDWTQAEGFGGKVRPVADLLDVSEGYETALEGWLEGRLENLVSEDPSIAFRMLEEVREQKQGRASVHIAQILDKAQTSTGANAEKVQALLESCGFEVAGELAKLVSVSTGVKGLAREIAGRLVSNVFVVKSLAQVSQFVAQEGVQKLAEAGGWSLVSLDGSALDCTGVLRGGSLDSNRAATLLVRKRTISELQVQVETAEAGLRQATEAAEEASRLLDVARAKHQDLQAEVQALEIQGAGLDRDVHQMNRALKEAENQLENAERDAERTRAEAEKARQQREETENGLLALSSRHAELETEITEAEAEVVANEAILRTQETELQGLRIEEASFRERAQSFKRELEASRSLTADRERRLSDVIRVLERASREREQFTGGDADIEQKIEDLIRVLAEDREQHSLVKDRLEQCSVKLNGALGRIKNLHSTGDQKTADANQLALEIEKFSGELAHLVQNLEEKYGLGCLDRPVTSPIQEEMTAPVVTAEMTAEEEQALGELVERLRERIRRLGEVNVMAIEEFETLKKRYDHLLTEKADLERSMENLQEAIEHINKTSEDRFRKAFDAIADRFEKLFPIIFGGGFAQLSLVYPEGSTDILEAGVDILAQPPGKKVVNITLLSGGEKALTAVSLIFAIFMVKPSPFCILDEVDAPLDDANIGKFNALLREMSAKSQFILITHNKRTMELNDTLYGVTMEEPGVSRMVSIEMSH